MSVCDTDKNVEESSFLPTSMFFGNRVCASLFARLYQMPICGESVYRNCEENRITCSLFSCYVERRWMCAGDSTQWQMHRGRLLYIRVRSDEYAVQQMYRRLVEFESLNENDEQQNPLAKNGFNLIYGHFCVWVNKINKRAKLRMAHSQLHMGERSKK